MYTAGGSRLDPYGHADPMSDSTATHKPIVVVGGGPAGLTAGTDLARIGRPPIVFEQNGIVGGLARTETYRGFYFDMGGHRFFTKVPEVERLWREVLGSELLRRPRLSRIYYEGKFFHY